MPKREAKVLNSQQSQRKVQKSMLGSAFSFFDPLPNEIVSEIFSYFNKVELARLAQTCIRFNSVAYSKSVWQKASGIKDYTKRISSTVNFRIPNEAIITGICRLNNESMAIGYTTGLIKIIKFNLTQWQQTLEIQFPAGHGILHTLRSDNRGNIIALRGDIYREETYISIFHGETGRLIYQNNSERPLQVLNDGTIFQCSTMRGCEVIHSYNPSLEKIKIKKPRVTSMTVDNKDNLVLGLVDGKILVWNKNFKQKLKISKENKGYFVKDLQILPNGNVLSIHANEKAYEWDLVTGKQEKQYPDGLFLKTNIILPDGNIISYSANEWRIIDSKTQIILSNSFNNSKNYLCKYWITTFGDNDLVVTDGSIVSLVRYGYKSPEVKKEINDCEEKHTTLAP